MLEEFSELLNEHFLVDIVLGVALSSPHTIRQL